MARHTTTSGTTTSGTSRSADLLVYLLAIFLPPVAVFLKRAFGADFWINILLCILAWFPGVIHAFYVVIKSDRRGEPTINPTLMSKAEKTRAPVGTYGATGTAAPVDPVGRAVPPATTAPPTTSAHDQMYAPVGTGAEPAGTYGASTSTTAHATTAPTATTAGRY